ncbi:MAG: hypothetical protein JWO31_919, partial [Phycisphaerales bacterium]|nr:hypothetical protein [Phycisphaerales bacterium]
MPDLRAGPPLSPAAYADVRTARVLGACKWDPQIGDASTLARFPLLLTRQAWRRLAGHAEALAAEARAATDELLARPDLLARLGVGRRLRSALRTWGGGAAAGRSPLAAVGTTAAPWVIRFDFHWTTGASATGGWQVSEANADVPGGYAEAAALPALVAPHIPGFEPVGDPAAALVRTLAASIGGGASDGGRPVALLAAPGYLEDQQVVSYLAARLRATGRPAVVAGAGQIRVGRRGAAELLDPVGPPRPLAGVVRFVQAEWLPRLVRPDVLNTLLGPGPTPVANPGIGAVVESKRFPLAWPALRTPLDAWRALLPETRDPRGRLPGDPDGWLLKGTFSNTGDAVVNRQWTTAGAWRRARWTARLRPLAWAAQRRFEARMIPTPDGPRHACVGVYTVDG